MNAQHAFVWVSVPELHSIVYKILFFFRSFFRPRIHVKRALLAFLIRLETVCETQ